MVAIAVAMVCCGSGCATEKSVAETPVQVEVAAAKQEVSRDEFGVSQGTVDVKNRYRSVVSIRNGRSSCSGVLVAPLLVLTAAHCFCQPRGKGGTVIDSSSCAQDAAVLSYFYERGDGGWLPRKDVTRGKVVVNASFRSELERIDGRMIIKSKIADLAAVHLERPLANIAIESAFGSDEVHFNEELTMVGYGATAPDGDGGGVRRFGRNIVSDLRLSDDRQGLEIRFRFPGAHTHAGDSGGPCFREKGDKRWLVGINGGYVSQGATESWFTSTFSHRGWIEEQMKEVRKLESR
jgi:hypothetical protein